MEPATSIDSQNNQIVDEIQSREEIINQTNRISFKKKPTDNIIKYNIFKTDFL